MPGKLSCRPWLRCFLFLFTLVALFGAAAKLASLQRANHVEYLKYRIAHADPLVAQGAVRDLASLPDPPLADLLDAAASPNRAVAREAKYAIGEILRFVQRNAEIDHQPKRTSRQLSELASALVRRCDDFPASDHAWLNEITQRVLQIANRLPLEVSPMVAGNCDTVLASISHRSPGLGLAQTGTNLAGPLPSTELVSSAAFLGDRMAEAGRYYHEGLGAPLPHEAVAAVPSVDFRDGMISPVSETESFSDRSDSTLSIEEWKSRFAQQPFLPVPAIAIHNLPFPAHASLVANPLRHHESNVQEPMRDRDFELLAVDSRELLARLLVADQADGNEIERELMRRGFGRVPNSLSRLFFSPQIADRLQLIDEVLSDPSVGARAWLILLADDSSADVRLRAATIMAATNDPELIEKAWEVATHDRDPRFAVLVERLQERRVNTQSF